MTPTLTDLLPRSGLAGDSITISGTNFANATSVAFNGTWASFTVNSATQITAIVPSGATGGPISVTTPSGIVFSSLGFVVGGTSAGAQSGGDASALKQDQQTTKLTAIFAAVDELEAKIQQLSDRIPTDLNGERFKSTALLEAGENFVGAVGGRTVISSASFTRPTDTIAYTSGDGVSNSTTAPTAIEFTNAARVNSGSGLIISSKLTKSSPPTTNASFRLWLFTSAPSNVPLDNAAFGISFANRITRIGYIDFTSFVAGTDCAESVASGIQLPFKLPGGSSLFGILQALGAYPPISGEQFFLSNSILQD